MLYCIDLTADDEAPTQHVSKRQRHDSSPLDVLLKAPGNRTVFTSAADEDVLQEDEELRIVGDSGGQVALRDLPHVRTQCGNCSFDTAPHSTTNTQACPQCFCYVCDINASACTMWGTGASRRHHCNAHDSPYWRALRVQSRAGDVGRVQAAYRTPFARNH